MQKTLRFILLVIGITALGIGFIVSLSIIIGTQYPEADVPIIVLSSINAIAVVSLAYFTYHYTKATGYMAKEMRETNNMSLEINNRPKVILEFNVSSNGMLYLVTTNEGKGAARNITFDIHPKLQTSDGKNIDRWPALKDGISYLGVGKKVTHFFDTTFSFMATDLPKDFVAHIEYDWDIIDKPRVTEDCPFGTSHLLMTDLASYKDNITLIDEIEKIRKLLEKR